MIKIAYLLPQMKQVYKIHFQLKNIIFWKSCMSWVMISCLDESCIFRNSPDYPWNKMFSMICNLHHSKKTCHHKKIWQITLFFLINWTGEAINFNASLNWALIFKIGQCEFFLEKQIKFRVFNWWPISVYVREMWFSEGIFWSYILLLSAV